MRRFVALAVWLYARLLRLYPPDRLVTGGGRRRGDGLAQITAPRRVRP